MNQRERNNLDRYITGNYGENQFADTSTGCEYSDDCTEQNPCANCRADYDAWLREVNDSQEIPTFEDLIAFGFEGDGIVKVCRCEDYPCCGH